MVTSLFTDNHLSKEEIANVVTQNIELLDQVPNEIKSIKNTSLYINIDKKFKIKYIAVTAPINKKVNCHIFVEGSEQDNYKTIIDNELLYNVLEIKGIQWINLYHSQSNRLCVQFE